MTMMMKKKEEEEEEEEEEDVMMINGWRKVKEDVGYIFQTNCEIRGNGMYIYTSDKSEQKGVKRKEKKRRWSRSKKKSEEALGQKQQ